MKTTTDSMWLGVVMVSVRRVPHRLTHLNTYFTIGSWLNWLKAHSVVWNSFRPGTMKLATTDGWRDLEETHFPTSLLTLNTCPDTHTNEASFATDEGYYKDQPLVKMKTVNDYGVPIPICDIYTVAPTLRLREHWAKEDREIVKAMGPRLPAAKCNLGMTEKLHPWNLKNMAAWARCMKSQQHSCQNKNCAMTLPVNMLCGWG